MLQTPYRFLRTTLIVWRLEPLAGTACVLKWKRVADLTRKPPVPYAAARSFPTPEQAAEAVAAGQTGVPEWDRSPRTAPREFYSYPNWQAKEPT